MIQLNTQKCLVTSLLFFSLCVHAEPWTCESPNKMNSISAQLENGTLSFAVEYAGKTIVEKPALGLQLRNDAFSDFSIHSVETNTHDEYWHPVIGEREQVRDHYNSLTLHLMETTQSSRRLTVEFRAFNQGVAFRYIIPKQVELDGKVMTEEKTEFRFAEDFAAFPMKNIESSYSETPTAISQIKTARIPLTIELGDGKMASLFEAYVANQAPCQLKRTSGRTVQPVFRKGTAVIQTPMPLSWRGFIVGKNAAELVENRTIVENLNPPCAIADPSWIRPGKHVRCRGDNGRITTDYVKRFIDFLAQQNLDAVHIDWSWYGTERKWSPEAIADFQEHMPQETREKLTDQNWIQNTTGNPMTVAQGYVPYLQFMRRFYHFVHYIDLDIHEVIKYGKEKNVGLSLYVNGGVLKPYGDHEVDAVFDTLSNWGVSTVKAGFVACESQDDVRWLRSLVESAARHQLTLCIHDAYIADGMRRTYPNILTQEGGGGRETNPPVEHELMLPFTRHLVGAHDHTPTLYSGQDGRTKLYELAQLVVYHGARQSLRDLYRDRDQLGVEAEFLREVPTVWDEVKILKAEPGDCIITARRNGDRWFIGGMNDETPRDVELNLDFLEDNITYEAILFTENAGNPDVKRSNRKVTHQDVLSISMLSRGGIALILRPAEE